MPLFSLPVPVDVDSPPIVPYVAQSLPTYKEAIVKGNGDLFPWLGHLSTQEYPYDLAHMAQKWKASLPEAARKDT